MRHRPHPPLHHPPLRRRLSDSRSKSGTLSLSGLGILLWTTVLFVGTILWISASSVKLTKLVLQARNVLLLGGFATMHSTFTASAVGSRHVKCVHWITVSGSSKSMATRRIVHFSRWSSLLLQHVFNRMFYPLCFYS